MSKITKERLTEDTKIFERFSFLRLKENKSKDEIEEMKFLFKKRYIDNNDIRTYIKTL